MGDDEEGSNKNGANCSIHKDVALCRASTTSPMPMSNSLNDNESMESVSVTQNVPETANLHRRPIRNKKAQEQKRKDIMHDLMDQGNAMAKVMKSYKESYDNSKEFKVMMMETSTIETPARRAKVKEKQKEIMAKQASRCLNFDDDIYHPEPPSDAEAVLRQGQSRLPPTPIFPK
ncbi:unnamed protein product [Prunus brigantina]